MYASLEAQDLETDLAENDRKAEAYIRDNKLNDAAAIYNASARSLYNSNRLEAATRYYEKALKLYLQLSYKPQVQKLREQLSAIYFVTEKYSEAIPHLEELVKVYKSGRNEIARIDALINLAKALYETGSYNPALTHADYAFTYANQVNDYFRQKEAAELCSRIYLKMGKTSEADTWKEWAVSIQKLLTAATIEEADQEVKKAHYETAQTNEKYEKTKEENRQQRMLIDLKNKQLEDAIKIQQLQELQLETEKQKRKEEERRRRAEERTSNYLRIGLIILFVFVMALTFLLLKIRRANKQINQQRLSLEKQNKEIKASIRYAQTIQQAMLPPHAQLEKYFESFIIYKPKDIVSGDFYWIHSQLEKDKEVVYLAVVDCTGHGVPGAFMSMIGNRLLNEIVSKRKVESPAEILKILNDMVRTALRQEETDNNDGMDLALCRFELSNKGKRTMTFAGAKRPVYIIDNENNKLVTHAGDRKSIGGYSLSRREVHFTDHQQEIKTGDMIYLFSDGIIDQNGPDRKKFGRLRLEEALVESAKISPIAQKKLIEQRLDEYQQQEDQRDDISLVGLKVL
ncbi:MAG: SpoIIE family protein phosphatase [Bacteroidales bacterium]|nr:SpoIIE family protein phosphatase [Bacteroidales bacterium]